MPDTPQVRLEIAAEFPKAFFLENIAVRHDNSLLITVVNRKELYYVPPFQQGKKAEPFLLHTFDALAGGVAELEPDVFAVLTGNVYTTHDNYVHRLDLRGWQLGDPVKPEQVLAFPAAMLAVNGCCAISPETILVADCFGGAVWRVDFSPSRAANAKLWLKHETMAHIPDTLPPPPQPGINGIRYSPKTNHVYYTSTGQKLFMRIRVDPATYEPAGEPECLGGGGMYDDFCIDETRGCAYLTVHRENRIDRAPLEPRGPAIIPVAGYHLDPILLGPSSAVWSRAPGEEGRVAFVTTDGGHTAPPEGGARAAKVLRMELL